jgi:hypothetical protein
MEQLQQTATTIRQCFGLFLPGLESDKIAQERSATKWLVPILFELEASQWQ